MENLFIRICMLGRADGNPVEIGSAIENPRGFEVHFRQCGQMIREIIMPAKEENGIVQAFVLIMCEIANAQRNIPR